MCGKDTSAYARSICDTSPLKQTKQNSWNGNKAALRYIRNKKRCGLKLPDDICALQSIPMSSPCPTPMQDNTIPPPIVSVGVGSSLGVQRSIFVAKENPDVEDRFPPMWSPVTAAAILLGIYIAMYLAVAGLVRLASPPDAYAQAPVQTQMEPRPQSPSGERQLGQTVIDRATTIEPKR
jgi:hypothetical protein